MKKITLIAFALFIGAISFNSCKKYEEGPGISLRSKTSRLVGDWKTVVLTKNNEDQLHTSFSEAGVTTTVNTEPQFSINKNGTYTASVNLTYTIDIAGLGSTTDTENSVDTGKWEWNGDKTKLILTKDVEDGETADITTSDVMRLTNKELILESIDDDGDLIRMELEKK